jgi:hypothetical protein
MHHGLSRSGGVFVVLSLCGILSPHCVFSASTPELPLSDLVRMALLAGILDQIPAASGSKST